jgi:ethanolamine utilization protein EutP (predicted NTPase)
MLKTEDKKSGCLRKRRLNEGAKGIISISGSEQQSVGELPKFLTIYEKG